MRTEELDELAPLRRATPGAETKRRIHSATASRARRHRSTLFPRLRLHNRKIAVDTDLDGEHLALDPVSVAGHELALGLRYRQDDPVGELEALVTAHRVHGVDQVVPLSFEEQ